MMDLLFKLYFAFFYKRGKRGAEASVIVLAAPLTFSIYLLIIFGLSFVINISDMGGGLFVLGLLVVAISVILLLRNKYVVKEKYKTLVIKHPVLWCLGGIIYFIMANIIFSIGTYLLYI